ncbi:MULTISPECIES: helix-turn-helix transcriptional regulator [unclassified Nocardiopsis]|uniref:helix-turn-helix domain-containing protein n=1 Tax=unclassified Nocardiopsis TaxID=2649073 RepID=UPI00135B0200|nr:MULTISPECIES: helix-turn-helix transcriptional regulator [unclassified Nocardiopsis]
MLEPESIDGRRGELSEALRRVRKRAGFTGERLAASVGMSQSKISKIETGKLVPSSVDVERILRVVQATPQEIEEISSLARLANTEYQNWRASLRRGLHHKQAELATLEATSSTFRYFLPAMITGLLQTPEYARASLASLPGDHTRALMRRFERQSILYDTSKDFTFLLTEQALRWPLCRPGEMSVQLERIAALSELPNVRIGVIPLDRVTVPEGPLSTFTVYDQNLATVETFTGALLIRSAQDVALYIETFHLFEENALFGVQARDFVRQAAEAFRD